MTAVFPEEGLTFLRELAANNNKDWFQAHKKQYEKQLKKPSRAVVESINEGLAAISADHVTPAGKAISRINRDIRFSKDKTPYNTRVWAGFHNQRLGKGAGAGFYVGWSPDGVGVGAGCWAPPKDAMTRLREHIAANHEQLAAILDGPYGPLQGDAYKRVPKPWTAEHPAAEWLKFKGMHVKYDLDADLITSEEFVPTVLEHFRGLHPLVAFLDDGLSP